MPVRTGLTGPFPRSEALVTATRDLDRGRTSPEAVEELYATSEREVLALEERLGFDTVTAGYLRWADLFRPIAETWEGFTVGPLTRWFETNTFYRQPILHAPPVRVSGAIAARLPPPLRASPARARVILPGPYTLAGLLDNRSGETESALVHRLGRLLGEEVRELRGSASGRSSSPNRGSSSIPPTAPGPRRSSRGTAPSTRRSTGARRSSGRTAVTRSPRSRSSTGSRSP